MDSLISRILALLALATIVFGGAMPVALADALDDLAPGHWYRVPNSRLDAIDPCPERKCAYSGTGGIKGIMKAWSGGALDRKRGRLIVFGGGHRDYFGNDVYAFDVNTLQWSQIRPPSLDVGGEELSGLYPDGTPRSRHTYNSLEYAPTIDTFLAFGAPGTGPSSSTGDSIVHALNLSGTPEWSRMKDMPLNGHRFGVTSLDPVSGDIWHQASGNGQLGRFTPETNTWQTYGSQATTLYATSAFDPVRKKMLVLGGSYGGQAHVWDLSKKEPTIKKLLKRSDFAATNSFNLESRKAPGLTFDEASDQYVVWDGGATVYTVNPETWAITRLPPSASNSVVPTQASPQGTYGRFRYVPSRNLFILVNSTDEDVYFYRLSNGGGTPTPPAVSINASPVSVVNGGDVTLTWTATGTTSCTAAGDWSGARAVTGTMTMSNVTSAQTYLLSCTGPGGTDQGETTVDLSGPGQDVPP